MKKNNSLAEGPDGLVYTARLPLSSATLNWLSCLIRGHLKKIGSRWRALSAGRIAGIVLAVLRCDQRPGDLAAGNGVTRSPCLPLHVRPWARGAGATEVKHALASTSLHEVSAEDVKKTLKRRWPGRAAALSAQAQRCRRQARAGKRGRMPGARGVASRRLVSIRIVGARRRRLMIGVASGTDYARSPDAVPSKTA